MLLTAVTEPGADMLLGDQTAGVLGCALQPPSPIKFAGSGVIYDAPLGAFPGGQPRLRGPAGLPSSARTHREAWRADALVEGVGGPRVAAAAVLGGQLPHHGLPGKPPAGLGTCGPIAMANHQLPK